LQRLDDNAATGRIVPAAQGGGATAVRIVAASAIDEALRQAWDELAGNAAEPNSFAERWFAEPGLRAFAGADADARLVQVWQGSRLGGLLPVTVAPHYGRVPVRHVQNWRHANSFLGVPLIRRGFETQFWTEILAALDRADWAPGFLHVAGLAEGGPAHAGLIAAAGAAGRRCEAVHREVRALLASPLSAEAYYADTVRKKKRKELGRLQRRLGDLGTVTAETLQDAASLGAWCDAFLALEHGGWKGRAGSSLASAPQTDAFFREALAGAFAAGRLEFRRMNLDGKPIAMLVNFLCPPGSFSFKTAFDEAYAKYSPGVLIQLDNLQLMERSDIEWMDSCAAPDHPMIDSLWGERRAIVRVSVKLGGLRRGATFKLARGLESASAHWRGMRAARGEKA
jgi:CelD/BcsL family acetyltransferase involved in cellulose biosynthesis